MSDSSVSTAEDELRALKKELAEAKAALTKWSTAVENAAFGSEERKEAKDERTFYSDRVKSLEQQVALYSANIYNAVQLAREKEWLAREKAAADERAARAEKETEKLATEVKELKGFVGKNFATPRDFVSMPLPSFLGEDDPGPPTTSTKPRSDWEMPKTFKDWEEFDTGAKKLVTQLESSARTDINVLMSRIEILSSEHRKLDHEVKVHQYVDSVVVSCGLFLETMLGDSVVKMRVVTSEGSQGGITDGVITDRGGQVRCTVEMKRPSCIFVGPVKSKTGVAASSRGSEPTELCEEDSESKNSVANVVLPAVDRCHEIKKRGLANEQLELEDYNLLQGVSQLYTYLLTKGPAYAAKMETRSSKRAAGNPPRLAATYGILTNYIHWIFVKRLSNDSNDEVLCVSKAYPFRIARPSILYFLKLIMEPSATSLSVRGSSILYSDFIPPKRRRQDKDDDTVSGPRPPSSSSPSGAASTPRQARSSPRGSSGRKKAADFFEIGTEVDGFVFTRTRDGLDGVQSSLFDHPSQELLWETSIRATYHGYVGDAHLVWRQFDVIGLPANEPDYSLDVLQDMVEREIRAYHRLSDVQGELVPRFLGVFNDFAMLWVTVTTYEGVSAARLKESGELDQARLGEIRAMARSSLQRIHELGVLHGDVAPRNALFREQDGKVLWIDFEFASVFMGDGNDDQSLGEDLGENDQGEVEEFEDEEPGGDDVDEEDGVESSRVSFDRKCQRELAEFDHLWAGYGILEDDSDVAGEDYSVDMRSSSSSPSSSLSAHEAEEKAPREEEEEGLGSGDDPQMESSLTVDDRNGQALTQSSNGVSVDDEAVVIALAGGANVSSSRSTKKSPQFTKSGEKNGASHRTSAKVFCCRTLFC